MGNNKEERVNQLIEWMIIKGVDVDERDIKTFNDIIGLARNDGYKKALEGSQIEEGETNV